MCECYSAMKKERAERLQATDKSQARYAKWETPHSGDMLCVLIHLASCVPRTTGAENHGVAAGAGEEGVRGAPSWYNTELHVFIVALVTPLQASRPTGL